MIINVHAGHNPDGKTACGAIGLVYESTENRKVVKELKTILESEGHTVIDCTCNDGTSISNVITKICNKSNARKADLDISIHFNSGANDKGGNGKSCGVEVLILNSSSNKKVISERVCERVAKLGFKNRGVKYRDNLSLLKKTNAPCILVECCFVDDKDDIKLYDPKTMARAIAEGVLNKTISSGGGQTNTGSSTTTSSTYKVGERVVINSSATKYATGQSISAYAKSLPYHTIKEVKSDRCLLQEIESWVFNKDLLKDGNKIAVGAKVKITGSKYATGESVSEWAKTQVYTVEKVDSEKCLLKEITSWVYTRDLTVSGVSIDVNSRVKINSSATKYATGQSISAYAKSQVHTVHKKEGDKCLLKEITSWVYTKDLYMA